MLTALVTTLYLRAYPPFAGNAPVLFAKTAITTTVITTIVWIVVTLVTKPEPESILKDFYRKARPDVRGWQPVARLTPEIQPTRDLGRNLLAWILGCAMVYLALFGLGELLLDSAGKGIGILAASLVCAALLYRDIATRGWSAESEEPPQAAPMRFGH